MIRLPSIHPPAIVVRSKRAHTTHAMGKHHMHTYILACAKMPTSMHTYTYAIAEGKAMKLERQTKMRQSLLFSVFVSLFLDEKVNNVLKGQAQNTH